MAGQDQLQTARPGRRLHLCLDKGYEAEWLESCLKARRWVVERTHSWMNRFRRILTRREKKVENYEAMLHFSCSIIVWNKILLG